MRSQAQRSASSKAVVATHDRLDTDIPTRAMKVSRSTLPAWRPTDLATSSPTFFT